jgi:hypothetical protein
MRSVPTGSTTVLQRSGGRLRRIRTYQLRFPPVETHEGARRSNGQPDVAQTAQPAIDFRIGEVLTGLPAADQETPDDVSRFVPPTPEEAGKGS